MKRYDRHLFVHVWICFLSVTLSVLSVLSVSYTHPQEMQCADPHLASFSLSLQPQRGVARAGDTQQTGHPQQGGQEEEGECQTASATDVIVPCFSMTAPGKNLLVDASLRIVSGKRYGVMGSNGCGKSTLLHFLAARRLPIPNGKQQNRLLMSSYCCE
jgi:ABC-type glutathione transport system ATPase component